MLITSPEEMDRLLRTYARMMLCSLMSRVMILAGPRLSGVGPSRQTPDGRYRITSTASINQS